MPAGRLHKPVGVTELRVVGEYSIHRIDYPGNISRFGLRQAIGKHFVPIRPTCRSFELAERRLVSIMEQGARR